MSKVVLEDTASGYALSTVNNNFESIETELNDKVLYRDNPSGEPNQMENILDMNGFPVINLGAPIGPNDAARLSDIPFDPIPIGTTTALLTTFTPSSTIAAINVQAAIEEVVSDNLATANATQGAGGVGFLYSLGYTGNTVGKWLKDLALSTGASFIGFIQSTAGAVLRTVQAKLRERVTVTDCGVLTTNTATQNAAALLVMLEGVPDGTTIIFPPGDYPCNTVDATPIGSITIKGRGARLVNATQVATLGTPILRLRGSSTKDVTILGLEVSGPRITSSSTVGTGVYASNGYPSGIDIYTARKVTLRDIRANGTYYAGIEAHYITDLSIKNCRSENHGYAGIIWSDCVNAVVDGNTVDDVGSTIITDGYGFSATTSYNSPSTGKNDVVVMTNNYATRCKRKAFDAHSAIDLTMSFNTAKGFGNSGFYAVCEGVDKQIRSVRMIGNKCMGDTSFVTSANGNAFDVGLFGGVGTQEPSFTIEGNEISDLVCVAAFACNNATVAKNVKQFKVLGNTVRDSTFTYGVSLANNTPSVYESVDISNNDWIDCVINTSWMLLTKYSSLFVVNNTTIGTTGSSLSISIDVATTAIIERNMRGGILVPTAQYERYSDGLLIETTQTFGGTTSTLDLLSCDLGTANDNTVLVQVDVVDLRGVGTTGAVTYSYNATGVRTGAAAPVWAPAAATNMTVVTTVHGAATAPKLIWNVVGNVGTLQFQPQDTFAAYIIKALSLIHI